MPIHRVTKPSSRPIAEPKVRKKKRSTSRARARHVGKKKSSPVSEPQPAVRAAKVARGKRLVQDPDYPPPQVVQSVARLLARNSEILGDTYL